MTSGVVDDDVETAEALHSLLDQLLAEGFLLEVAGKRKAGTAFLLDQGDDLLCVGLFRGQIVDGDIGAFARICDRGRAAHAGIAACDQRLAAGEPPGALVAGLAVIGTRLHLAGEAGPGL